jgi:hypothetical protein
VSSPKHDLQDLAARFARKARSDEIALDKLADDPDVPDDLIGFHAQQGLEKLLKAALAHAGVAPPRIHDLGELMARLADVGLSPPASASEHRQHWVLGIVHKAMQIGLGHGLNVASRPHDSASFRMDLLVGSVGGRRLACRDRSGVG